MKEERMMILQMLQEGKITAEEAHDLLEALALSQEAEKEGAAERLADEVSGRIERAVDVVEEQLEKVRENVEDRLKEVKVRIEAARDRAEEDAAYPVESLEDVLVTVERGFSQFAKEFPEAIGRLFHFDFGPFTGYTVERTYEGTFGEDVAEGRAEASAFVSTRNGSVTWETWDGPGYKVTVTSKVRAEDEDAAEERAAEATVWETTETGFRLAAADRRGVSSSVHVLVPRNIRLRIETETRNGSVRGKDLTLTAGQFNTANGSIRLEDIDATELQAGAANGSIRIVGAVEILRGTTAQGSIDARLTDSPVNGEAVQRADWKLRTSNGSIRVHLPEGDDIGYEVDLKTGNGRARAELPGFTGETGGRSRRSVIWHSDRHEDKPRRIAVQARTANGSIRVTAGDVD
ncbi:MAG: DUF4097 family beta strand repeat-containing protein [Limnochordales bacterium]